MTIIQKDAKSAPQKVILMTKDDHAAIADKVRDLIKAQNCDAIIAANPANFTYCSGVVLPYAEQFGTPKAAVLMPAKEGHDVVVCPPDWHQLTLDQKWEGQISEYTASDGLFTDALIKIVAQAAKANKKIGLDIADLPVSFVEKLKNAIPEAEWIDISDAVSNLRVIKTDGEIKMLAEAARITDRACVAALNHSEGTADDVLSYYLWEFAERLRVHIGEFGGSGSGMLSVVQGSDMRFLQRSPNGVLTEGEPMRFEITGHHHGFWSDCGRTVCIGNPCPEFEKSYDANLQLKKLAVEMLKPGVKTSAIFNTVQKNAEKMKIDFFAEAGAGHGVGVTEHEAPYLSPNDDTVLAKGMVIVVSIYTYGPKRELICSKDTYVITDDGAELLSWYKNYDKLYRLNGTHSRHG